jgi:hypothetical protein
MTKVEYRVKNYRSQPIFDREILDKLKLDELEFLCRKYYKDLKRKDYDNITDNKKAKQRYKQLCEEIESRRNNLNASSTYYYICKNNFDIDTGYIYDVRDGTLIEHVSFNVKETDYVVS